MPDRLISADEVSKHATLGDLWIVVDGVVYDVSLFAEEHPGGVNVLLQYAGHDATSAYLEVHALSLIQTTLPVSSHIGKLDSSTVTEEWKQWTAPRASTQRPPAETSKPPLDSLISAHDFQLAAEKSFSPKAWAFVSSAATDCYTRDRNASAYSQITLRPRVLKNVSAADLSTTMLGCKIRSPIFCAPTSMGKMFHPDGERELGRGCKIMGIPQMVSTSSSFPLAEVMDGIREYRVEEVEGDNDVPVFFQLYMDKNRKKSKALLGKVKDLGVRGVFLTVDCPVIGKREADERIKADESMSSPMSGIQAKNDSKGGALGRIMGSYIDPSTTWDDIAWIRRCAPGLPVALKGIQTAMDALKALEYGVDAILLSNHGGRSLDTSSAPILVLLELQKCCPQVFDKMEVYVDGGISRGTDIFKALCLGARAVGVGRGFLYALNYGIEGIKHYVSILNDELETTMKMCGVTSVDQVHPGLLHTGAVDHLIPVSAGHPYARWRPSLRSKL